MNSPESQLLRRRTGAVRAAALAALALALASTTGCALSLKSTKDHGADETGAPAASAAPTAGDSTAPTRSAAAPAPSGTAGGGLTKAGDVASSDRPTAGQGGAGGPGASGADPTAASPGEDGTASGLCAAMGESGANVQAASRTMWINDTGGVKRITGKAETLTVEGVGVVVYVDAVDSLVMNGTGDTVCAGSVGSVSFGTSSVGSSVVYEGADPVITDEGTGSVTARK